RTLAATVTIARHQALVREVGNLGVLPALGRTLRRVGQGCRRIETEGESRWTKEEKVRPPPRRTARRWNGSPSASSLPREPSTVLRASCSRRGPRQNCSGGGGYQSRMV